MLGGRGAKQARSPGRQGRQAGKVARQARSPGRQGRQAGEAARQPRPVRPSCAGGARCGSQSGVSNRPVMS